MESGPVDWVGSGEGRLQLIPDGGCGYDCREAFYRRLDSGSVGKGLLHGSPWQIPMKETVHGFKAFIVMAESA